MNCVTDTHALVWYLFALPQLSAVAKNYMDGVAASGGYIFIPSISLVEITYLEEKGRLGANVLPRINSAIQLPNGVLRISGTFPPGNNRSGADFSRNCPGYARSYNFRYRSASESAADFQGWQHPKVK